MYSRYIVTCVRTKYCKPLLTHLLNFGIKGMLSNVLVCNVILLQEATLMHNNEYFLLFCLFDSMSESKSRIFFLKIYIISVYITFKNVVTNIKGFNIISIY